MNVWRMVDGFVDSLLHSPLAQVMQIKTAPVNELRSRLTRGSIPTVESTPKLALGFPIRLFLGSSPSPSRPEQTRFCCRGSCCRNRSLVNVPHPSLHPSTRPPFGSARLLAVMARLPVLWGIAVLETSQPKSQFSEVCIE